MTSRLKPRTKIAITLIAVVGAFEGLRTYAYRDPVGIPTICFGETRGVRMGDYKTVEQCKTMLGNRLIEFERGVRACLKSPDTLPEGAYVASLSFAYNVGEKAFCSSQMRKKLDAGDIAGACDELPKWVYARGIKLPGLVNRRAAEREICKRTTL